MALLLARLVLVLVELEVVLREALLVAPLVEDRELEPPTEETMPNAEAAAVPHAEPPPQPSTDAADPHRSTSIEAAPRHPRYRGPMRTGRATRLAIALITTGCGGGPLVAAEPSAADLRIAALFPASGTATIVALTGDAPFRAPLPDDAASELWIFQYALPELVAQYPALEGLPVDEVVARLAPRFVEPGLVAPEDPPLPSRVLHAALPAGAGSGDAAYRERPWSEWLGRSRVAPRRPFALGILRDDGACGSLRVEGWAAPATDVFFEAAAPLSGDRAVAIGFDTDEAPPTLMVLGPAGPALLPTPAGLLGRVRSLTSAGADTVYGMADRPRPDGNQLFALDARGSTLAVPHVTGAGQRMVVRASADGLVLVSRDEGVVELSRGATVARPRADFDVNPTLLHVVRRDRLVALDARGVRFGDGRNWATEHMPGLFELPLALSGDDALLLLTGETGLVMVRDEADHRWIKLPAPPLGALLLWSSTPMGRGHFLVVGARGYAAVWTGQRWCAIDTGTRHAFFSTARSPGSGVAWAVAAEDRSVIGDAGRVLRVERVD